MTKHLLAGLALSALTAAPALAERVYFNDFEAEGVGGTKVNQRSLKTVDVAGRVDVITPVNRFGYAPRTTFIDLGGGLIGGEVSPKTSFAFNPGDRVTISFDASGNQLRSSTFDVFGIELDITGLVGEGDEQGYLTVSDLGGTGAFDFITYWPEVEGGDPPPPTIRIYERYFAQWGGFGFGGAFPGDFAWTGSSLFFVAEDAGRIDFKLYTQFGGYGPLIDNLAIDIAPNTIPRDDSFWNGTAQTGQRVSDITVPAPGGLALLALGLAGLGGHARRRRG